MTVYQSIHSAGVLEAYVPGFTHSAVTRRFGVMQRALGAWIEAERDLEHSGSWDPACDHWLRDAEAARTSLASALDAVCATEPARMQDQPLRQMARIARVMLLASDEVEFGRAFGLLGQFAAVLRCDGSSPIDQHVNAMLAETQQQLAAVAALPDYALDAGDEADRDFLLDPMIPSADIDTIIAPVTDLSDWLQKPLAAPAGLFQTHGMVQRSSLAPIDMAQMPSPDQPGAVAA